VTTVGPRYAEGRSLVGFPPFASRAKPTGGRERRLAVLAADRPLQGDEMLDAVTEAMVALHEATTTAPR